MINRRFFVAFTRSPSHLVVAPPVTSYFEILDSDWSELDSQYLEAGWPDTSSLDPRVRDLLEKALRKSGSYDDWLESRDQ
jgi:hypothetical protein